LQRGHEFVPDDCALPHPLQLPFIEQTLENKNSSVRRRSACAQPDLRGG
jgi:hypothetical protein